MHLIDSISIPAKVVEVFINGHGISIAGFRTSAEGTKSTSEDTNVGLVNVDVGIEECPCAKTGFSNSVCKRTNFVKIRMVVKEKTILV